MNKYEEAWNNVKSLAETSDHYKECDEDIRLIKELVDKQIPKKTKPFFDSFKCPRCKEELNCDYRIRSYPLIREDLFVRIYPSYVYCEHCGQRIVWE